MVNEHFFRGSNCVIDIFASIFSGGQLLKERICSSRSKFFYLKVDPFEGFHHQQKQMGIHKSCLP